MTDNSLTRPHFRRPPIHEQAISLVFDRIRDFDIIDHGLFWTRVGSQFPQADTAPRLAQVTEHFEDGKVQLALSAVPSVQLPRSIFRNAEVGELLQIQDNALVFNWIREASSLEYPRFEKTSERLWELFGEFEAFIEERYKTKPDLIQAELTNINLIPTQEFGDGFEALEQIFRVDPFGWGVPGLVAETYVRRRQHKLVDRDGRAIGRLHSVISPVFVADGTKSFQFELTARSAPEVRSKSEAMVFFEVAHQMINGAFLASVTGRAREHWEEYDGK